MSTITAEQQQRSWAPMIAIALAQVLMSFNVASLPVALSGMVNSFNVPPTDIATGIIMYSLSVAAFVMAGSKLSQRFGPVIVFRVSVLVFGCAQIFMVISQNVQTMIAAQALCGLTAAALVPSLVALIAENYKGKQQATALGSLGSARAGAGVAAFLIGGVFGTWIGWRPVFAVMIVLALITFALSFRLRKDEGDPSVQIDVVGLLLAASAIVLLSLGFNNLNGWGGLMAKPAAPFTLNGLSPAPVMIVVGFILLQGFVMWNRHIKQRGRTPLIALEVMDSPSEKAAVTVMFAVVALEAMLNFTVPLYIQIVQGRTPMATTVAMLPFNLSVFFSALLVIKLYDKFTPKQIATSGFIVCCAALVWLSWVVTNNWSEWPVMVGLIVFGMGQGALVTLVFNVLVSSSPKSLASDVGALRGTTSNLANAIGTAVAGALLVGLLSASVMKSVVASPVVTAELQAEVNLDNINFVSNERLATVLENTSATPAQVQEAMDINETSRLKALKLGILIMALISALAILPARRLPGYSPGNIPV
ncbi:MULTISPECIES: MFS transporter [Kluyvera]|uniref:MFS transporter n=1 Tax=Kluyvera TaxID=579 RepID=UPI001C6FF51E|nr:MFS transporter [Kluyvera sp. EC_51]